MIYLDNHATTACDPRVVAAMLPYFSTNYGNPGSPHALGQQASEAVARARAQVADLLGAEPTEIVFTSGATEANNLAIVGAALQHESAGGLRRRIVTSVIEHKSVLEPCEYLATRGWEVIQLPVDSHGFVQWDHAERLIDESTLLVSLQAANSEIGTIQDIRRMAKLTHRHGALLHCDAAQAVGKIPMDIFDWPVDLLSLSAHKFYGPKGVGALYIRGGGKDQVLTPLMRGGSQEYGLRPGTVPVPLVVGMGVAAEVAGTELVIEQQRMWLLRDRFEKEILKAIPTATVNGDLDSRLPHNSSITFRGVEAEALMANLSTVALSTGAACESGSLDPSRVLLAIGRTHDDAFCTVRMGLGRFTTADDLQRASKEITEAVQLLRTLLT